MTSRFTVLAAATTAVFATGQVFADDIAALEARIAALESQSGGLSFGNNTKVEIYGYAKGDFIQDLDSDLGNTIFGLGALESGSETGSTFTAHAFQSRLGFRTTTQTDAGEVKTRIEGDFFGGGGGDFRLRHAYGEFNGFLVGQAWTNFMPIESYPATVDFQGPAGIPFLRNTQARYTANFANGVGLSFSIEEPPGDSSDPAFTAAATYGGENFFVKAAALATNVDFDGDEFDGWGVNLSGNAQLWSGGSIQASLTRGEAISSWLVFGGDDVAVVDGSPTEIQSTGVTLAVTQDISDRFSMGLAYGLRDNDQGADGSTESLETAHLNFFYHPVENVTVGLEFITGEREVFGGESVRADRVQAAMQFNF